MKLSKETISVLKNFSTIQPNLVVKPGSTISTLADAKNIIAEANVKETFPQEFGIYNLNEFINALSLVEDPELEFSESYVTIVGKDSSKVTYHFADPSILTTKEKEIAMPPSELSVTLTDDQINTIRRAAGALGQSVLSFTVENDECIARVKDPNNASANSFSIVVKKGMSECYNQEFCDAIDFQFLIANLKLIPGTYNIEISSKLISTWNGNDANYFIALEKTSKIFDK